MACEHHFSVAACFRVQDPRYADWDREGEALGQYFHSPERGTLQGCNADPSGRRVDKWVRDQKGDIQSWNTESESDMLWTVFAIFLILWGLGLLTGYTMNGFIHILLAIAIVVMLVEVTRGRR